jgi:imidazoleglycerol-phosphate dehydratase
VAIDLGGRAFFGGRLPSRLYEHWMRSFADAARLTLHVRVIRGRDRHHVVEAAFKALGLALRDALVEGDDTVSTKGTVAWEVD